jgi:type I restriction enzyme S subunit
MEISNNRKDWTLEKLGDFADYGKGKNPKNQSSVKTDIFKYPYINIKAFEKGIIESYTDGEKCNFCSENDFLMVWDGSRFGLVGKGIKGALGSTLMKINFPRIENQFAYYFLKSKYLEINSKPKGTGTPHVNPELLWNYIFPIAPLLEQRAIVSKIEQLFSDLDNGIENFKKAQAQLKIYRQAILKNACEGKLVPTAAELARVGGRDYEPADVLLARILKERREKWNGKGKYKEPAVPDTTELSELPEFPGGWEWINAEQLTTVITDGEHITPERSESGILLLSARNILNGKLSLEKVDYVPKHVYDKISNRLKIEPGDVLLSCSGSVGRSCVAPNGLNFTLVRSVAVLKPVIENGNYISYCLRSPILQKQINEKKTQTAQSNIFQGKIRKLIFPLPPISEQRRIVAEVERRLSLCDKMKSTIAESLQKAESLRQSILKKAFEGKLLNEKELKEARNAPDWEPAEKLVERIRQEKQIKEKNNKPTRRKTYG